MRTLAHFQNLKLPCHIFSSNYCCLGLALSYSVRVEPLGQRIDCRLRNSIFAPCRLIQDSLDWTELDWIPGCGFRIPGTGFRILCQWNLDSRLQSLVGFRVRLASFRTPKPRVPDPTGKNFSASGIRVTLYRATRQRKKIPFFFLFSCFPSRGSTIVTYAH